MEAEKKPRRFCLKGLLQRFGSLGGLLPLGRNIHVKHSIGRGLHGRTRSLSIQPLNSFPERKHVPSFLKFAGVKRSAPQINLAHCRLTPEKPELSRGNGHFRGTFSGSMLICRVLPQTNMEAPRRPQYLVDSGRGAKIEKKSI